ncbi:hypothetical protein C7Q39_11940 [Staphylococcus aureus]|uniref:hypothetical protein n=1 Tax=Staphylococcus aureus TaxID=1280 RepID=UPI000DA838E5|nr:hypothetical protein [Staphylococcus aureus]MBZ5278092.1 hypothetical protein [Staphylococcus aureus]PZK94968.1 hypothetical protein C7Q39_11940 [Staphylococcus aureus]HCT3180770.1 hypothetical protein [Staphylococcus aureus]
MKEKLKNHKYITKFGMMILGIVAVLMYLKVIYIISIKIYEPTVSKLLSVVHVEAIHVVLNFILIYPALAIFYIIVPIDVFRVVYTNFRKDIFGY